MNAVSELIVGNLLQRPARTLITVVAVSVEICLVVLIVGLTSGLVEDTARRTMGVGADLMMQPPRSSFISAFSGAPMPVKIADRLLEMPRVAAVAPVLIHFNEAELGIVYGIEIESFRQVSGGFEYVAGGPFEKNTDILVDDRYAAAGALQLGDILHLLGNDFTLRGIVEHGKGARLFIPLARMQELLAAPEKTSFFYIRAERRDDTSLVVEEIQKIFPKYKLEPIQEYMSQMTSSNLPGLDTFVFSMVTLGVVVGFLVIFLSMYTGILERTREFGILKSLGASKLNIVLIVLREAVALSLAGIVAGIVLSYGSAFLLRELFPTITIIITPGWLLRASLLALLGGVLGAVYPAYLATRQDAVTALAYE